jgi:hypothetical protein
MDALTELDDLASDTLSLSDLKEKAIVFKEMASALDEITGRLAGRCESGAKGLEAEINIANSCMMKLSRIINPVNYTLRGRYDQDYYGAEYVQPIPILRPVSELASLNPDDIEYKTLGTKLVRARNTVSDSLQDAVFIAKYVVERLS